MEQAFLKILNHSFAAGWMILAVILLRMLLKKAPKWTACLLWGFVAIRLAVPFHIESAFSLMPGAGAVPADIAYSAAPSIATGIQAADNIVNPALEKHWKPNPAANANPLQIWIAACSILWIMGVAAMLIYALASFLLLKKKVSASMSRKGYQEAAISYVDNAKAGWDYYSENPWETDEQRDRLAQAALQELYTLTGYQLKECVYTTDGRSNFIFGKSADAIKRSTAFYSRDYGWALAGDSTPHMIFVNARRVWYSDVQQIDSPYNDPQYQGHGVIPVWFLEHSGVYRGQKIHGYDVFDSDDMVFTHVKLFIDGGYYIVVMDEDIESASEISGPYYEREE